MYDIDVKKKVNNFINSLQNSDEIFLKLKKLKNFKFNERIHLDIERYNGKNKNLFRLRIGEVRFIFEVFKKEKIIYIKLADYRGKVYK